MNDAGPTVAWVQLHDRGRRAPFLVELFATGPARAAFLDLAPSLVEVAFETGDATGARRWLDDAQRRELLLGYELPARDRSDNVVLPALCEVYWATNFELSARAVDLLAAPVRVSAATMHAEWQAVFRRFGEPRAIASWQRTWLDAVFNGEDWPDPPTPLVELAARLGHGHWLRLRGGAGAGEAEPGEELRQLDGFLAATSPRG